MNCQKCKSTKNLCINSRRKNKEGNEIINYICRSCNTERFRKYRATPEGRQRTLEAIKRSTQKHMDKHLVRMKVKWALKTGKLIRPDACTACKMTCKPEAHHADYSKPLEVKWMCRACHADEHKAV